MRRLSRVAAGLHWAWLPAIGNATTPPRCVASAPHSGFWLAPIRRQVWFLALILAGGCLATAAAADSFVVTTNFYNVSGTNWWDVHASKTRARPWTTNMHFDATTRWNLRWTYNWARTEEGYRATSVGVAGTAVITMPRWIPPPQTPPATRQRWLRYIAALMTHEQGHVSLARAAAVELRKELEALPAFPTRQALNEAVEKRSQAVIQSFKEKERDYDQRTGHGATQGASYTR